MSQFMKTLTAWLMILACFNLSSCSDDENENASGASSLKGTWQYKEDNDFIVTYTFDEKGSFQVIEKEYYNGKWDIYTDNGEYEYENKILTLYYNSGDISKFKVISLTSQTLKIEEDGYIIVFQKI